MSRDIGWVKRRTKMSDYKRLTVKNWREGKHTKAYERLAELEDKLEDGRLWEAKYLEPRPNPFECAERWGELWFEANCQLNELKGKIENGTLIELPCKVGDKVYFLSSRTIREETVTNVECFISRGEIMLFNSYIFTNDADDKYGNFYRLSKLGKSLFLTEAEAEAKLRELKGE